MKALPFLILVLCSVCNSAAGQRVKRVDSVVYLQKIADSLTGTPTFSKNVDTLYHIVGSQYLKLGKDSIAARYLLRVQYDNQQKFNELGTAFSRIRRREDSSFMYFRKAADANVANNGKKNIEYAFTCKNLGDQFVSRRDLDSGLLYYQQAVVNLVDDFNEEDFRLNPYEFKGKELPHAQLYDVLLLKAKTLVRRFNADGKVNDLVAAMYTYNSLDHLAPDSTEGFEPVDVSVKLFELTADDVYLRHAFSFAAGTEDVKKLQKDLPNDHAVIAYRVGDTSLIGLFLSKSRILHSRTTIDSLSKLFLPFEKESADKNKLIIIRDKRFPDVKFKNDVSKSKSLSYIDSISDQTFPKEKTYSFIIWIMVAVVAILAIIVIKKIN